MADNTKTGGGPRPQRRHDTSSSAEGTSDHPDGDGYASRSTGQLDNQQIR